MNQVAFVLEYTTLYWYSLILALSVGAGICFFMACCSYRGISALCGAGTALLSLCLGLLFSRLLYWNCRADSFQNISQALTAPSSTSFALAGAFLGCGTAALLMKKTSKGLFGLMDCMSVAGCGAIALGRLGNFFTSFDRGQIVTELTHLPWAYPVLNSASGLPEYRLATFLFQAVIAGTLFLILCFLFFSRRARRVMAEGDLTLLFLLVYCASQIILDSTRYDSLYLRINGFVSMVQILAAAGLAVSVILFARKAAKARGITVGTIAAWITVAALFGGVGYMEYFVQRHGNLAPFAYGIMEHCLVGIVDITLLLWKAALKPNHK